MLTSIGHLFNLSFLYIC